MNTKKANETPSMEADHLEVYPERKQVSAFPERRFIKTNRMLAVLTFLNLACIIAGSCLFAYTAKRVDVKISVPSHALLYQMDTEEKRLKASEYMEIKVPAKQFVLESYLKRYITELHSVVSNAEEMIRRTSEDGFVLKSSNPAMKKQIETSFIDSIKSVLNSNPQKIRDVHIYNLHPYRGNLWTAVIETFDFLNSGDLERVCNCFNNSDQCLECKAQQKVGRQRRRVWIRTSFKNKRDKKNLEDNPFGIRIDGYYVGYMPLEPKSHVWDLPPELKPEL